MYVYMNVYLFIDSLSLEQYIHPSVFFNDFFSHRLYFYNENVQI